MTQTEQFAAAVKRAGSVVFFGGAGVSTESGIPDFRSADGLYNQKYSFPPEVILSHSFFMSRTEEFFAFYREKMLFLDAKPNAAHLTLARLEAQGKLTGVVTQNIDGLHLQAGSKRVYELHGSVYRNYCMKCGAKYGIEAVTGCQGVPRCSCGGIIRPEVVLYEESLDDEVVRGALRAVSQCDMLIIAGTSLAVYPAAGFVDSFNGDTLAIINKSATPRDGEADMVINCAVGEVLGAL